MVTLIMPLNKKERDQISRTVAPRRSTTRSQDRNGVTKGRERERERRWAAIVEAWEIRGWSLKVREEPLSTGSSQNESCYLILLSTLLRFIRQLFDALQYAANRAWIVCRRPSLFSTFGIPSCLYSPFSVASVSLTAYTYQTTYIYISAFLCLHNLAKYFLAISYFLKSFTYSFFINTIIIAVYK